MPVFSNKKLLWAVGIFLALWLGTKYILPVILPFLLGMLLALAAEPAVNFAVKKGRLPRTLASGLGVSGVLVAVTTLLSVLGAFIIKEVGTLISALPDLQQTARDGVLLVQDYLINVANSAPDGVRPLLTDTVMHFFDDGTAVMDQVANRLPGVVANVLGAIPDSALGIGTGILAGFMISARMPQIKERIRRHLPKKWKDIYLPAISRVRSTLWGWFKAQATLALVTYGIVTAGFLLMKIPFAPAWAALVALVDAVPLLGTGTILGPCALVSILQGQVSRAVFYLCIYAVAFGVRTTLEPKLVGRHLGLDPLVTLFVIYVGYRFWGFLGLIFAPMLTSAAIQLLNAENV